MSLINIQQLEKTIENFHLGPIHLAIERGTITALVGNNGSGKSTLLKLMMNLIKADNGRIQVTDKQTSHADESWKKNIAYQPQTLIGYAPFTGYALKRLNAYWYPMWDEGLFNQVVEDLSIPLNKRFEQLSPGVKQKLSFALTIARNTPILILDEPTAHIDMPAKHIIIDYLINWMDDGHRAILIASHQIEDIKKLADYICILKKGRIIGHFEKESLIENYARYWFKQSVDYDEIPGEIARDQYTMTSNDPKRTEQFLMKHNMQWMRRTAIDLEEIITFLLTKKL